MSFNGDLYPTAGADVVMTTKGDLVRYDSQRERYGIGSTNQVLSVTAGLPAWKTLTTADSVLTTQGDVLIEGASGLERLGFGTSGYFLTTNGTGANPTWTAGGVSNPVLSNLIFNDNISAAFGTSGTSDSQIYHDGNNLYFVATTGVGIFNGDFTMISAKCMTWNRANATIVSGEITGTSNTMLVDTEGAASTDDLDSASFEASGTTGAMFTLGAANDARTVVVKDQASSPFFLMNGDFSLENAHDTIFFNSRNGATHNYEISRSDNA